MRGAAPVYCLDLAAWLLYLRTHCILNQQTILPSLRPRGASFLNRCLSLLVVAVLFSACSEPTEFSGFILEEAALPDYEQNLDHARLITEWSQEFFHRGMVTYRTACFSCHGNPEQPGSIPNSRQFWTESFKNGADPYSMYQSLTRGTGLMPPQVRLTPREKYDVIQFIREEFIKERNPDEFFEITDDWIASLPKGDTLGPAPQRYEPWKEMDYGNFLMRTYELADDSAGPKEISGGRSPLPNEDFRDLNFAYKGIAIRLDPGPGGVAAGQAFVLFDHDLLRLAGFWTGEGFIDYEDILLDDQHNVFPRTVGHVEFENPITPGWANPATGYFDDPRFVAVDGRPFGPLPRQWAHYKGLYYHNDRVVLRYTVGEAEVFETYDLESEEQPAVFGRTLNVAASSHALKLRIAPEHIAVEVQGHGAALAQEDGFHILAFTESTPANVKIWMSAGDASRLKAAAAGGGDVDELSAYIHGGPPHYREVLTAPIIRGEDHAYAVDVLTLPQENPWNSRMRPTGLDFMKGGDQAVVSTIDGEVWLLDGITRREGLVRWRRMATGLFQPLGIKVHDGAIFVGCRDQIAVLRDLNGDGETDYYESFNSDHQVTEHFHEFAMGLQTDPDGNFYYAKSARHARTALIPQHGTLIRVSPDGSRSDIIANGFRAANGVLRNDDGSFIVTDQEGFWNPMNRVNWVEEGGFYGNMYGYGAPADSSDAAMIQPLLWIDQKYDRSPAELLRAESESWGPLEGHLLSLSYGYGKIFVVLPQFLGTTKQAGMVELPVPQFPTGIMRGRFNPKDGQLYVGGMSAWATNQMIQVGGLYRVRYTGAPLHLPLALKALEGGMMLTFAEPLDEIAAQDPDNYKVTTWDLKRTRAYGSRRYNTRTLDIDEIWPSSDGKTIIIRLPEIAPTWIMEITYELVSADGAPFKGVVQNTIYALEDAAPMEGP